MERKQPGSDLGFFWFGEEQGNLIALIVTGAALAAADVIVPRYYSGYPYVAAAVKLAAALVVINILLARLKSFAEKFA